MPLRHYAERQAPLMPFATLPVLSAISAITPDTMPADATLALRHRADDIAADAMIRFSAVISPP